MFWKVSFWKVVVTLLVIALLIAGGAAIFRAGYAYGYAADSSSIEDQSAIVFPHSFAPSGLPFRPHPGFMPFFPIPGLICGGGLLLMLLFGIGGLFRFRAWHVAGGPNVEGWNGGRRGPRRGMPYWAAGCPWAWDWQPPEDKQATPDKDESPAEE
ncbi:MAG: hypothetical protein KKD28_05285 [Chloroflexi bacterium]|nr:hypothetical protein [Chloroflexota bacterium]